MPWPHTPECVFGIGKKANVLRPHLSSTAQPHPGASQLPRLIRTRFVSDGENVFRARIDLVWFLFEEIIHLKSNFGWLTDKYFMFTTYFLLNGDNVL